LARAPLLTGFGDIGAVLFSLAREYSESAITRPFPLNAYYAEDKAPQIDPADFRLNDDGAQLANGLGVRFSELLAQIGVTAEGHIFSACVGQNRHADCAASASAAHIWFDGKVPPRKYGFPMKLCVPTKLGFKNPKHIGEIEIGNDFNGADVRRYLKKLNDKYRKCVTLIYLNGLTSRGFSQPTEPIISIRLPIAASYRIVRRLCFDCREPARIVER
jgi:molybdopterin-dependent oxidoreductase-like protein protein